MIRLNYRDARPIYEQVRDGLRHLVVTGAISQGEAFPSVRAMAASLAINPNTIQRAYAALEDEGYLVTRPGVGAFADAAASLEELGLGAAVADAVAAGAPFLGICLGMHLMFEHGAEHAPEAGPLPAGLGLVSGTVGLMPKTDETGAAYKIPHVGWNSVEWDEADPLFDGLESGEYFYFTHSFAAPESVATIGRTTHSVTFPSAVRVPGHPVWGVQFHPEKSSDAGARLLANFVTVADAGAPAPASVGHCACPVNPDGDSFTG